MKKLCDLKLIFLAIFLLLAIAIKSCENFQLRDLNDGGGGGSETSVGGSVSGRKTTRIRYPFKKLEKLEISAEEEDDDNDDDDDDDNDDDNGNDDDNDSSEDYKFEKVRKPTFEVKKRTNLRFSKLAQFRDARKTKDNDVDKDNDDDDDDDEDDESEEKVSIFSRVLNFFKRKSRGEEKEKDDDDDDDNKSDENDDDDDESAELDDDKDDDDDLEKNKPFLTEVFEKIKDFLEAREKQQKITGSTDDSDEDNDDDTDKDDDDDKDKEDDEENNEVKTSDNKKSSVKEFWISLFNRKPFNLIFDFDESRDGDDLVNLEDSEEDEMNYRRLLKEEQEHEREHTEQLIKQTSEEETTKSEETPKPITTKSPAKRKSKEEAHLAQKEFEKLLLNLPSFVPDYSKVKNSECQKQGEVFQRQLRGQRIWALQMMDANAKIPSGLMRGNTNQLGDFDLCTRISQKIKISETNSMKMRGKYCLANIDVVAAADQLKLPVHLIQGRNFIRSTINDPNHFFPRYSTINWGLCLPSACTYRDADQILESFIGPYNSTGIKLHINVNEDSCYVRQHVDIVKLVKNDWKIFGTCSLLLVIVTATFLATMNDYLDSPIFSSLLIGKANNDKVDGGVVGEDDKRDVKKQNGFANQILRCFSLKRNLTYMFTASDDDVKCLHGLKALSIVFLIISLKLIPMGRVPYSNRNKLTEFFNSSFSVFIRTSFLYEDVFFLISGLLTTFSILKVISSDKKSLWLRKVVLRVLRLLLPLAVVVLFYAFIWEHLSSGPQWSAVVDKNADLCKNNMWKNFLFIQNFFRFEEMCATHTYHLAVDMQLMMLSPFLIFSIYKYPSFGLGLYGVLHALSAAARFSSTVDNRLSIVVFHGMKLSQLYRTFNMSLSVAIHRATPYLSGISLGILIKAYGHVKIPFGVAISGWISTFFGFIWCFYTPSNLSHKDYQYDPSAAAQYSALSPMIWSISIAWIIFACHSDASWKLNDVLSSRLMIFLSRISYSLYLIVFLVFFYFSGTHKSSEEFYISSYIDRLEIFILFTIAIFFTLSVDIPLKNIAKLLFNCESPNQIKSEEEKKAPEGDFESPFNDDEDDFFSRRTKLKVEDTSNLNINGEHMNGNIDKETETDNGISKKSSTGQNMNARRWKWEVLD